VLPPCVPSRPSPHELRDALARYKPNQPPSPAGGRACKAAHSRSLSRTPVRPPCVHAELRDSAPTGSLETHGAEPEARQGAPKLEGPSVLGRHLRARGLASDRGSAALTRVRPRPSPTGPATAGFARRTKPRRNAPVRKSGTLVAVPLAARLKPGPVSPVVPSPPSPLLLRVTTHEHPDLVHGRQGVLPAASAVALRQLALGHRVYVDVRFTQADDDEGVPREVGPRDVVTIVGLGEKYGRSCFELRVAHRPNSKVFLLPLAQRTRRAYYAACPFEPGQYQYAISAVHGPHYTTLRDITPDN
jgi:hypothetical protein